MKKKALFLDRDGIINIDHGYVCRVEDFEFVDGIFEFIKLFLNNGFLLFIVTNQSGIGRGYYSEDNFLNLTEWMLKEFKKEKIFVEDVFYCPHSPEEKCKCRKPQIGMLKQALEKHTIDLNSSFMIGDKQSDIDFAINSEIKNSIYVGDNSHIKNYTYSFKSIIEAKNYLKVIING